MKSQFRWPWLLVMAASFVSPAPAYAWTEASVHSVRAHVDLHPDGTAVIAYELAVSVHAGWVEGLEVAGLDPNFELLEALPASWVSADGEQKYSPVAQRRRRDRLFLSFRRSTSPRRGQYSVRFAYRVALAADNITTTESGQVRVTWTLPGWSSGLDGVWVTMRAPPGAIEANTDNTTSGVEAEVWQSDHQTLFNWHRAHLPRTMDWTVIIDVPPAHMSAGLYQPARAKRDAPDAQNEPEPPPSPLPFFALAIFGALICIRRLSFSRACRRRGSKVRPLIPTGHEALRVILILASLGAAGWFVHHQTFNEAFTLLAFVALLGVDRTPIAPQAPKLGTWRPTTRIDLRTAKRRRIAERLFGASPLDPTALCGWITLGAIAVATYWAEGALPQSETASGSFSFWPVFAALIPIALTGTRLHLPTSPHHRLRTLTMIARSMRAPVELTVKAGLRLMVHEDSAHRWQDVRLRVYCDEAPTGLLRCDVAIGQRRDLGGYTDEPQLVQPLHAVGCQLTHPSRRVLIERREALAGPRRRGRPAGANAGNERP